MDAVMMDDWRQDRRAGDFDGVDHLRRCEASLRSRRRLPRRVRRLSKSTFQMGSLGHPAERKFGFWRVQLAALWITQGSCGRADAGFTGGLAVKSAVQHIGRTLEPGFYKTSRQGQFRYDIPLKSGLYEMRLHFAETMYGPDTNGAGGEGSRVMTVHANGQTLLSHLMWLEMSGSSGMADVKVFSGIRASQRWRAAFGICGRRGQTGDGVRRSKFCRV